MSGMLDEYGIRIWDVRMPLMMAGNVSSCFILFSIFVFACGKEKNNNNLV